MKPFNEYTLPELKNLRDLIEYRIMELRRHKVDDEYFPPYTDKEIQELKNHEQKAQITLKKINKTIREKLDDIINNSATD